MPSAEHYDTPSVFVSYRRDDEPWLSQLVVDDLRRAFGNERVFYDLASLGPGATVSAEIDRALGGVTVVVAVVGPRWGGEGGGHPRLFNEDDWVRREIATALRLGVPVIPVLVGETPMPTAGDLPADVASIADKNAIGMSPAGRDDAIRRLVLAVWTCFWLDHDTVFLGSERHQVLTGEFLSALKTFAKDNVVFASQLASGTTLPDFGDEEHRAVLVALLPDAEEWDELNPKVQRLLKSRRYYRLVLIGVGVSSGYLSWDEYGMRLVGSAADEVTSLARSAGVQLRMVDALPVVSGGHVVDEPAVIADVMSTVVRWITPIAGGAPPAAAAAVGAGGGGIRRVVRWFRRGLAERNPSTIAATVAAAVGATGVVLVTYAVLKPSPDIENLDVVRAFGAVGQPDTFEIYRMHADGSQMIQLTDNASEDVGPQLHGDRITFSSNRAGDDDIYVMKTDGRNVVQLTDNNARDWCPAWSPDGSRIAFTSDRDGNQEIFVMSADGRQPRRVTHDPANDRCPAWSPDGGHLVFAATRDGDSNIYTIAVDGTGAQRLTDHPAADTNPDWSPDGKHIVFVSDRDGNNEIYTMRADGSLQTRITNNSSDDDRPLWVNDRQVLFGSSRGLDTGSETYVMDLDGRNLHRLTSFNDCKPGDQTECATQ
jgi:Tol biopolymer transport system component